MLHSCMVMAILWLFELREIEFFDYYDGDDPSQNLIKSILCLRGFPNMVSSEFK